uniref:Uncharacterized protein n=1 Tax=viral metagenome TaxID=1070528 RepID=A0A6C0D1T3_9ZZZZ
MCFNAKTSITIFILSFGFFFYLVFRGVSSKKNNKDNDEYKCDIYAGIMTLLIGSMQLVEFFLWKNQICNKFNHSLSITLFILLYLQPILRTITASILFQSKILSTVSSLLVISCSIFTIIMMYNLNNFQQRKLCSLSACSSGCRLRWAPLDDRSISMTLFWIFYFLIYSLDDLRDFQLGLVSNYPLRYAILPITLLMAVLYTILFSPKNVFGSVWCFLAIVYGPIAILRV